MGGAEQTARATKELVDVIDDALRVLGLKDVDEQTKLEGYLWLFEYVTGMVEYHTHADPADPVVMPMVTPFRRFLGDLAYARHCYVAQLSAEHTYRLTCQPGDARFTSVTVYGGESAGIARDQTLGNLTHRDLHYNADGSFDIVVGRTADAPNAIRIDERVGSLMTREFFYSSPAERTDARWSIAVIDGPPSTGLGDRTLAAAFDAATSAIRTTIDRYPRPVGQPVFGEAAVNEFADLFRFSESAVTTWGNLDAIHSTMAYDLEPHEAIVIEGGPAVDCAWWGLSQNNRYLASFRADGPTALPGGAVRLEADGRWRAVLSARDPGGDNWLSTGGHRHGVLRIRWLLASEMPERPRTTKVAVSEL